MPHDMTEPTLEFSRDIWSVSRLNRELSAVLQGSFPLLWVQGEVSNLARPASGHWYFSLKDQAAQVRCVMFRQKRMLSAVTPANGQQLMVRARIGFYEPRGDCQLIVEHAEPAGEGALRLALDALKRRLAAEGLFNEGNKRPLPAFPLRIGIVTSASGAALHDLLTVLSRRWPLTPVLIYPAQVQGDGAPSSLIAALELANTRADSDLLILARGGGSFEDLMAFNDERVVRAVRASAIPILTGIGHEIDISLADLAADLRAATPSAAAERATPSQHAIQERLHALQRRITTAQHKRIATARQVLVAAERHLSHSHPSARLQQQAQRLDYLDQRLKHAMERRLGALNRPRRDLCQRLEAQSPLQRIHLNTSRQEQLSARLISAQNRLMAHHRQRLIEAATGLQARSPLATLARGYAIVTGQDDRIIRHLHQINTDARLTIRIRDGHIRTRVEAYQALSTSDIAPNATQPNDN